MSTDTDECKENLASCNPLNSFCSNTNGSFICPCHDGYSMVKGICEGNWSLMKSSHVNLCVLCHLLSTVLLLLCLTCCYIWPDDDECKHHPSPCGQLCRNNFGSYQCYCKNNSELEADGSTCKSESLPCTVLLIAHPHVGRTTLQVIS